MELTIISLCVCLFAVSAVLLLKYVSLKRNIRHFSQELEKLKDSNYRQPVKITDFDKDIAELAVKVNEHTDIQRQLEKEYEQSRKQLGAIISGISHDFRTPLTASLGYLQMIEKSGELSEKNEEYLSIVMQKNKYLKELSDEFFELTKIENNSDELNIENINLSNILTETVLEQHSWISERNIAADFDISEGIIVQTDQHCLSRILNNLMSNAQKYTADRFETALKTENGRVVLRVCNTLSDSSSVNIERVFEPFYRMEARTTGGSGLGLYVIKILCEKLGWNVSAAINDNVFSVKIIM